MEAESGVDWDEHVSDGAAWTRRTAPMALSIVIERLKTRSGPMSYGELAEQIYRRYGERPQPNKQKYGRPLGAAADAAIARGKQHGMAVPPLSLIVIREDIGYPGTGVDQFVGRLRGRKLPLRSPERLAILDEEATKVWEYGTAQWERLERLLGLAPLPKPRVGTEDLGPPPEIDRGGSGERAEHLALKEWVAAHPEKFREFGSYSSGETEVVLLSGDSIDAMLVGPTSRLAVEVKASYATQKELIRGIFQCVKYRNTLEAEARVYPREKLPGSCILVSTKPLAKRTQAIADLLSVPFRQLAVRCEEGR